jgi:hypothetical protein
MKGGSADTVDAEANTKFVTSTAVKTETKEIEE